MEDLARTSHLVGDGEASFAAWSRCLELVDSKADPLQASRLLVHWSDVAYESGRFEAQPLAEARRAVQLSEGFPDSTEYAVALANLGACEAWSDEPEAAQEHAEAAVQIAQRSGDSAALSCAFNTLSLTARRGDLERAGEFSEAALRFARLAGDPELIASACVRRHHDLRYRGDIMQAVHTATEGIEAALDGGTVQGTIKLRNVLARQLLALGRLSDSGAAIREGLGLTGIGNAGAGIRLAAALLTTRRGELEAAQTHLQRAKELIPHIEVRPGMMAPPIVAEYLLARHQPERALDMLARTMPLQSIDTRIADEMLMWGARAAADLAQHARDHHDAAQVGRAKASLDRLIALRDSLIHPTFEVLVADDLVQPAMAALFEAETQRCVGERPTATEWEEAADRCGAAGMRWEQMIASWRWVQARLDASARPSSVATTLRTVYQYAITSEAAPLLRQVRALSAIGRIPLQEPVKSPRRETGASPFTALTKREHEVLTHLVAGRTYAEIASTLFISEKTVSVHISNLLRKTGTSSRREVAALAIRLGEPTAK
jgi:DNA-binding CsgD family transcriptional regulator/tetratricopeptide (TPR) repeat protein